MKARTLLRLTFCLLTMAAVVSHTSGQDDTDTAEKTPHLLTTFDEMVAALERAGVPHQAVTDKKTVRIATNYRGLAGVMLIRWQDREGVLQYVQPLPIEIPKNRVAAMETAMVRLNHTISLPGFGLDHSNRQAYYRFVAHLQPRGGLDETELKLYFQLTITQAAGFMPPLKEVADVPILSPRLTIFAIASARNRVPRLVYVTPLAGCVNVTPVTKRRAASRSSTGERLPPRQGGTAGYHSAGAFILR